MFCSPKSNTTVRVIAVYTLVQVILGIIITSFLISDQTSRNITEVEPALIVDFLPTVLKPMNISDFEIFVQFVNFIGYTEASTFSALQGWTFSYLIVDLFWLLSIGLLLISTFHCVSDLVSCYFKLSWIIMTIVVCLLDVASSIFFLVKWNELFENIEMKDYPLQKIIGVIFFPLFCSKAVIFWIINVACIVLMIYRYRIDLAFAKHEDLEKYDEKEMDNYSNHNRERSNNFNHHPQHNDRFDRCDRGYDNEGFTREDQFERYPTRNQLPPRPFNDPPVSRQFNTRPDDIGHDDDRELADNIGRSNFILKPTDRIPKGYSIDSHEVERYPPEPRREPRRPSQPENYNRPPPENYLRSQKPVYPTDGNYGPAVKRVPENLPGRPGEPQQPRFASRLPVPLAEPQMRLKPNDNWNDNQDDRYLPVKRKSSYQEVHPIRQMAQAYKEYKHRRESEDPTTKPRFMKPSDDENEWEDAHRNPSISQYGPGLRRESRPPPQERAQQRIIEEPRADYYDNVANNRPLRQREPPQPKQYFNESPAKPVNSQYGIPRIQLAKRT